MVLTGLFAGSLSGLDSASLKEWETTATSILSTILFVLIGCCIDFGKYLFWIHRDKSYVFSIISIALMLFSLLASCAFFYTAEAQALVTAKETFIEVAPEDENIKLIEKEIAQQEKLLENRLASKYHSQWEKADENAENITNLNDQITLLKERRENRIEKISNDSVTVTSFFKSVGIWLNVDTNVIRGITYFLLSLFLEVTSLASISLRKYISVDLVDRSNYNEMPDNESDDGAENDRQMERLADDIISGRTEPVLRKILKMSYGLSIEDVRSVLSNLCEAQVLERGKRNVYRLSGRNANVCTDMHDSRE